jgi:hypothetical protein
MDFKTLMEAIDTMNDEELFLVEKKAHEERKRRDAARLDYQPTTPGSADVPFDLVHLVNAVREKLREELSMYSEPVLASLLDQTKNYSENAGDEMAVIEVLRQALTAALVHEARCEMARRMDSIK